MFVTIYIAAALVIVVVMVFLQDWRAMLLPIIDIVVALIGTFVVMAGARLLAQQPELVRPGAGGRHRRRRFDRGGRKHRALDGQGPAAREATIKAMDEITGPVIGITLVLMAVFIPTAFIPGLTGQFFRQFALTIAVGGILLGDQCADHGAGPRGGLDQAARRREGHERSLAASRRRRVVRRGRRISCSIRSSAASDRRLV